MADVWKNQAVQWERVGPPLRPSPVDGARIEAVAAETTAPRVLILGVTPEMARLRWPPGTTLLAVDRNADMIARVWPGYPGPGEGALLADWTTVDLPAASRDLVASDGPFGVTAHPHQHRAVLRLVRRVLAPGGRFVFRVFSRPHAAETPADVYAAGLAGRIGSFHAFKLRLLMACQPSTEAGVTTGAVWDEYAANGPGAEALAARTGWPLDQVRTIEAYRGQDTVYCFPTLAEVRAVLAAEGFRELSCAVADYELAERCPTLVVAPA